MKYLVLISAAIGLLLVYLLSSASANTDWFSGYYYYGLLAVAGALALLLSVLVGYQFWQLVKKIRARVFGAQLTLRLALFFTVIAILPGVLVYALSVQFLSNSIESWFDVRVEKALEGGLNLGRSTLENSLAELSKKGRFITLLMAEKSPEQYLSTMKHLVADGATQEVSLFDSHGRLLAFASRVPGNDGPDVPDAAMLREALTRGAYSFVDAEADKSLELRVLVVLTPARRQGAGESGILQFSEQVPRQISDDAETVKSGYSDYRQLTQSRLGLKRLFGITLTLSLLIVLLSAIAYAFFLANRMSAPLALLAQGARAVAQGDFSWQQPSKSSDELGMLTRLFNRMTQQLSDARTVSEHRQREVEAARAHLESVLAHLSSGVVALDEESRLRSANNSAAQILGEPLARMAGTPLADIAKQHPLLRSFVETIEHEFAEAEGAEWQRQVERLSRNGHQVLLIRGTQLPGSADGGRVIVFDDITHLLQAERNAAWGEVARRLAHEIKNPLTPIQLSAERLQHKLSDKLDEADAKLLQRAIQTIVAQVGAMKDMVLEFADYARAPSPQLAALDMHHLLHDVVGLYEGTKVPVCLHLEANEVSVRGDPTRLRQVIHNLLQNAQDALDKTAQPQILLGSANEGRLLHVWVQDNGTGFPDNLLSRAFEPYVTTKLKGTGLGLAIVKKIVEEHGGVIAIENVASGGTRVSVTLPLFTEDV